ncbi:nascent polypeptide-associated complex subunit alpha, muscle-specific form-like [Senna tora]|uniref:Nascent polypeptide-associated complex subunit alpha, muscle-specific form-like n=1 Tax=Senna tora TaxID=362788 RepID=A0A834T4U2_9FABA|nr:nascent polypeptide-associated complex subunit alpha, muscle-specific form-like [Senna tora]
MSSTKPTWQETRHPPSRRGRSHVILQAYLVGAMSSTKPMWQDSSHPASICGSSHVIHEAYMADAMSSTKPTWQMPCHPPGLHVRIHIIHQAYVVGATSSTKPTWRDPCHPASICGSSLVIHEAYVADAMSSTKPTWQVPRHPTSYLVVALSSTKHDSVPHPNLGLLCRHSRLLGQRRRRVGRVRGGGAVLAVGNGGPLHVGPTGEATEALGRASGAMAAISVYSHQRLPAGIHRQGLVHQVRDMVGVPSGVLSSLRLARLV